MISILIGMGIAERSIEMERDIEYRHGDVLPDYLRFFFLKNLFSFEASFIMI